MTVEEFSKSAGISGSAIKIRRRPPMIMKYKDVEFDCFVDDELDNGDEPNYWAEICEDCWNKYKDVFGINRYDDSGSGVGACGVKGCESMEAYIYVDFARDEVEIIKGGNL